MGALSGRAKPIPTKKNPNGVGIPSADERIARDKHTDAAKKKAAEMAQNATRGSVAPPEDGDGTDGPLTDTAPGTAPAAATEAPAKPTNLFSRGVTDSIDMSGTVVQAANGPLAQARRRFASQLDDGKYGGDLDQILAEAERLGISAGALDRYTNDGQEDPTLLGGNANQMRARSLLAGAPKAPATAEVGAAPSPDSAPGATATASEPAGDPSLGLTFPARGEDVALPRSPEELGYAPLPEDFSPAPRVDSPRDLPRGTAYSSGSTARDLLVGVPASSAGAVVSSAAKVGTAAKTSLGLTGAIAGQAARSLFNPARDFYRGFRGVSKNPPPVEDDAARRARALLEASRNR